MALLLAHAFFREHSKCLVQRRMLICCASLKSRFPLSPYFSTCFNRIDLPMYETKADLEDQLKLAVTIFATGFDLE
jgi:hypothetical protein